MQSSQGAVLFVDMLGFGALTRGKLKLGHAEYMPWSVDEASNFPHQLLAAQLLLEFRRRLGDTRHKFSKVNIAQLSDCAFIWGPDVGQMLDAGFHLMDSAVKAGLLCRGGLAYGDSHEPRKVARSLGAFIVGDAVTRAVGLESAGKGARVFTDVETVEQLLNLGSQCDLHVLVNPLNGEFVNEWRWYVPEGLIEGYLDLAARRSSLTDLVARYAMLRYSPRFAWSASSEEGRRQLACSIVAISDVFVELTGGSDEFKIEVNDLVSNGPEARSEEILRARRSQMLRRLTKAAMRRLA